VATLVAERDSRDQDEHRDITGAFAIGGFVLLLGSVAASLLLGRALAYTPKRPKPTV
jgi:hypothetical protein